MEVNYEKHSSMQVLTSFKRKKQIKITYLHPHAHTVDVDEPLTTALKVMENFELLLLRKLVAIEETREQLHAIQPLGESLLIVLFRLVGFAVVWMELLEHLLQKLHGCKNIGIRIQKNTGSELNREKI